MSRQVVVIFPEGDTSAVEKHRQRWDPLGHNVRAHITLVFPVEDAVDEASLRDHLTEIAGSIPPFAVTGDHVAVWDNEYLFLEVDTGRDQVHQLHDALYDGPFKHADKPAIFVPHLTVGRIARDKTAVKTAEAAAAGLSL